MRNLRIISVLLAAGVLVSGSPVQASPETAKAAKKPLRAERRTDFDALACGTTIEPGSGDSTTDVTYYNCTDTTLVLAPTVSASDGSATVTYTSACQDFLPGEAWFWEMTSGVSARRPTFIYGVTECG